MKRTTLRLATFRLIHIGFVSAGCIGTSSLPVHAADPKPRIGAGTVSTYTLDVINDTHSRIDSFSIAPAGTNRWAKVDFRGPFDYQLAATLQIQDDDGCLRDLRTVLSNGRRVFARCFDLCHLHAYRAGISFRNGHPGSSILP